MSPGSILIILIIIGATAALFVVLGRDKKSAPPPPVSRPTRSTPVRGPADTTPVRTGRTFKGDLGGRDYPPPNPQTVTSKHGELSIFTYKTTQPFWICPNCECENSLNQTHCRVCLWDRSVEVR